MRRFLKYLLGIAAVIAILLAIYAIAMYASFTNSCNAHPGGVIKDGTCTYPVVKFGGSGK